MNAPVRIILKIMLPLLVIGFAGFGARKLIQSKPKAKKQEARVIAQLVDTTIAQNSEQRLDVRAQGTVEPARRLNVQSQAMGRVTSLHPNLEPGGLISKGDVVARIESRDYRLALKETQTGIADAEARLAIERGQQKVAQREWALFQKGSSKSGGADPSLALRKPQLQQAKLGVETAKLRRDRAKIDLSRTAVRAPFNAMVQSESVEKSQLVTSQNVIATLIGTDTFWVRAKISVDDLAWIKVPGLNGEDASEVMIRQDLGGRSIERKGRVLRLLGEIDPVGRQAQLLISVEDPLGLTSKEDPTNLPLLLGAYVDVIFSGSETREIIELPRTAVHDGDRVYVYATDDTLDIRRVKILWGRPKTVLVASGLAAGDRVITSKIGAPVQGMKLKRVMGAPPKTQKKPGGTR